MHSWRNRPIIIIHAGVFEKKIFFNSSDLYAGKKIKIWSTVFGKIKITCSSHLHMLTGNNNYSYRIKQFFQFTEIVNISVRLQVSF